MVITEGAASRPVYLRWMTQFIRRLPPLATLRDMHDQLGRVSTFIRERSPFVFCPPCIAGALGMTEQEVRERLQIVVGHPASQPYFSLTRRLCFGCGVMGDYVALRR